MTGRWECVNCIGERWHKWKTPVTSAAIKAFRTEAFDREAPWTPEELRVRLTKP